MRTKVSCSNSTINANDLLFVANLQKIIDIKPVGGVISQGKCVIVLLAASGHL